MHLHTHMSINREAVRYIRVYPSYGILHSSLKNKQNIAINVLIRNELQSIVFSHSFMVGWICHDLFTQFIIDTI